jgi:hypothetical protein
MRKDKQLPGLSYFTKEESKLRDGGRIVCFSQFLKGTVLILKNTLFLERLIV